MTSPASPAPISTPVQSAPAATALTESAARVIAHARALGDKGEVAAAVEALRALMVFEPDHPLARANIGQFMIDLGQFDEAIAIFERLAAEGHDISLARAGHARALFAKEDWPRAWTAFGVRFSLMQHAPKLERTRADGTKVPFPAWDGTRTPKHLCVIAEQGLGDTIQFARYLHHVVARGIPATLVVPGKLKRLVATMDLPIGLAATEDTLKLDSSIDWIAIQDLPWRLGIAPEDYATPAVYLKAEADRVADWAARLPSAALRIGICWRGNAANSADRFRSATLADFAPLAAIPGAKLVSLQKGDGVAAEIAACGFADRVVDLGADFDAGDDAFVDTAAVMENLDLIVTVDTSVGHVAGALGRPTRLLLSANRADWRWLARERDNVWYPATTVHRQPRQGDWKALTATIAAEIARSLAHPATNAGTPAVPVSIGELLDKMTILAIKAERLSDAEKLKNVARELNLLEETKSAVVPDDTRIDALVGELRAVNEALWDIEERIRHYEAEKRFDQAFIETARSVYVQNDHRARLKQRINDLSGSALREEKSYA
ncbi:DUF6165 family protein [Methyloraptor flagellatus]|uniref:DUF6165 family protein n=1 Tax=Methyloraptor flagellatus TaxID=3162530 RepID=A0AAU7XC86_9HYPH